MNSLLLHLKNCNEKLQFRKRTRKRSSTRAWQFVKVFLFSRQFFTVSGRISETKGRAALRFLFLFKAIFLGYLLKSTKKKMHKYFKFLLRSATWRTHECFHFFSRQFFAVIRWNNKRGGKRRGAAQTFLFFSQQIIAVTYWKVK